MTVGGSLQKAYLRLYEPSPSGNGPKRGEVNFQFNPKEYAIQKSASWESKPGKGAKKATKPEFKGAEARSMTIEIFMDATISPPEGSKEATAAAASSKPKPGGAAKPPPAPKNRLQQDIDTLFECCTPTKESLSKNKPSPPFVRFGWGKTVLFDAIVKQVSVKYTLFNPEGTPIRATASVTLQELPQDTLKQNPTSGTLAAHGSHTVISGDTLASIAHTEYGDPRLWRALAEANGMDDPMRLRAGTTLLVPPPDVAAANA